MDSFSKIVAIFLAVILLFIAPILYMAQKQDSISQLYVSTETTKFIDSIKNSGYVSKNMYADFIKKIDKTGNIYQIKITHSHERVEPLVDVTTNDILQDYSVYFYNTYEDEIFDAFDQDKDYRFDRGDYISIQVSNLNKTTAVSLLENILSKDLEDTQIVVSYGGMIRDEIN
ncbi:MAG: hypothetical protein ACK5JH_06900 [Anaerocolumna sp.]